MLKMDLDGLMIKIVFMLQIPFYFCLFCYFRMYFIYGNGCCLSCCLFVFLFYRAKCCAHPSIAIWNLTRTVLEIHFSGQWRRFIYQIGGYVLYWRSRILSCTFSLKYDGDWPIGFWKMLERKIRGAGIVFQWNRELCRLWLEFRFFVGT